MLKANLAKQQHAYTGDTAEAGRGGGAMEGRSPLLGRHASLQAGDEFAPDVLEGAVDDRLKRDSQKFILIN